MFEKEIVDAVGVASLIVGLERLKAAFDFVDGVLVEEFAEVGVAEDFLELRLIDGECQSVSLPSDHPERKQLAIKRHVYILRHVYICGARTAFAPLAKAATVVRVILIGQGEK